MTQTQTSESNSDRSDSKVANLWYLDSESSWHMIGNKAKFASIAPKDGGMDSKDENIEAGGREGSDTSSEEDIDTSKMLWGGLDPMTTENWVQEMEEIMVVLDCTDEQKVRYAAFKMAGEAKCWWLSTKLLEDQRLVKIALTWERFNELFFDRHFPSSFREEKIEEFTNLTQGEMTVAEYTAKFVELSCFAPFLIPNEARKARKSEKGLRCRIYELVVEFQVQNFSDLVDKASMLEKSAQSSTEPSEQKKRPVPSSFQSEASKGSGKKGKEIVDSICQKCNKTHRGECWFGTPKCFRNGKPGHINKNCWEPLPMVFV
ncbi:uncharacterized protein LOC131153786 [Malania oleifera]|uniref:uncharacterized protein LOC131153786 n=1 Tax=Malania oleifera TaxID=397392 RepID=UPI0025ADAC4E|nr:uncharacterized protein LOC131153786 [Malania oleifera]